jgi:hypothetical protein
VVPIATLPPLSHEVPFVSRRTAAASVWWPTSKACAPDWLFVCQRSRPSEGEKSFLSAAESPAPAKPTPPFKSTSPLTLRLHPSSAKLAVASPRERR